MATATQQDYYELLGVSPKASPEEIRAAYLRLAKEHHPDKTGGNHASEEKLKHISAAYHTLKNPEKRREYDESRAGRAQYSRFGDDPAPDGFGFDDFASDSSFADMLNSMFGGGAPRSSRAPRAGTDLETTVTITLRESSEGVKKTLRVPYRTACDSCAGSGAAAGSTVETCGQCGGSGSVTQAQGPFRVSRTCGKCRGAGHTNARPCMACQGTGFVASERDLAVTIPAGMVSGARLRLAGEGEPGSNGGPRGDVYVRVLVSPHAFLQREGDNVICDAPIPFHTAALGGSVPVPTLTGTANLTIPAGTQNGAKLRMRRLGMPHQRGGKGDQIVRIQVEIPTALTKAQREAIAKLAAPGEVDHYPLHRRFLDKLKRAGGSFGKH